MVQKSYGKMRQSRKKLRKPARLTINQKLKTFNIGDKVHVIINSSGKFQHPRFHGKTGTVLKKSGRVYVVEVRDGSLKKKLNLEPMHLKKG